MLSMALVCPEAAARPVHADKRPRRTAKTDDPKLQLPGLVTPHTGTSATAGGGSGQGSGGLRRQRLQLQGCVRGHGAEAPPHTPHTHTPGVAVAGAPLSKDAKRCQQLADELTVQWEQAKFEEWFETLPLSVGGRASGRDIITFDKIIQVGRQFKLEHMATLRAMQRSKKVTTWPGT